MAKLRRLEVAVLMFCVGLGFAPSALADDPIANLLTAARKGGDYHAPAAKDIAHAEILFRKLLERRTPPATLLAGWKALGFNLSTIRHQGEEFMILSEHAQKKHGRGFFAFRTGNFEPISLQSPHMGCDRHTGEICLRMFEQGKAVAGAWNTLHRVRGDLAHLDTTYLQSFTRAFAQVHPRGKVVQIHGFAKKKRSTPEASEAEMIVSGGAKTPTSLLLESVFYMKRSFSHGAVKLFPLEVVELGATTNTQGRSLRMLGFEGFIHVEMSESLRERMHTDRTAREEFLACLSPSRRRQDLLLAPGPGLLADATIRRTQQASQSAAQPAPIAAVDSPKPVASVAIAATTEPTAPIAAANTSP